ncbi:hypothetical protein [Streptomyces sp. NPDC054940]
MSGPHPKRWSWCVAPAVCMISDWGRVSASRVLRGGWFSSGLLRSIAVAIWVKGRSASFVNAEGIAHCNCMLATTPARTKRR